MVLPTCLEGHQDHQGHHLDLDYDQDQDRMESLVVDLGDRRMVILRVGDHHMDQDRPQTAAEEDRLHTEVDCSRSRRVIVGVGVGSGGSIGRVCRTPVGLVRSTPFPAL